jgi:protein TonB
VQDEPGPLERRANPITPENPIPRRISHVEAAYPPEAAEVGAGARITLRVTLDESGRVGEVRTMGTSVSAPHMAVNTAEASRSLIGRSEAGGRFMTGLIDAFKRAATDAVRQWQYDPPFKGPISFNVTVHFGDAPPPPPPPPVPEARAVRRAAAAPPPPPPPPPEPARRGGRGGVVGGVPDGVRGGVPGGVSGGVVGGVPGGATTRSEQQVGDEPLRVGGNIKAPEKIRHVNAVYPEIARAARVQGVVIVEVRIETDGTVSDVKVLRSIPLLDEAAIEAVRQWLFVPTLLNGSPVPIMMTTTINFRL